MLIGTVKWFDSKKGFGFIINGEGKDVFVHFSSIEGEGFRSLKDGEKVEYEVIEGDKGLSAKNVRRLPEAGARTVAAALHAGSGNPVASNGNGRPTPTVGLAAARRIDRPAHAAEPQGNRT